MLQAILYILIGLPIAVLALHTVLRIVRYFHKFPMPEFLANAIDNPLRRRIQPPIEMPLRHGIEPGMTVLEVGPGNGRYRRPPSGRLAGRVVAVDIEPKMTNGSVAERRRKE
jgi:hypothetical protein